MTKTSIKIDGVRASAVGAVVVLPFAAACAWGARSVWGDRLLWPALAAGFAVVLLESCVTVGIVLQVRRRLMKTEFSGGKPEREARTGEDWETVQWRLPVLLHLLPWRWQGWMRNGLIDPGVQVACVPLSGGFWVEKANCVRRCVWESPESPVRVLSLGDVLGLWSLRLNVQLDGERRVVLPALCQPAQIRWPRAAVAGDAPNLEGRPEGDRIDYRAYQQGDSARYVAWKLVARLGEGSPLLVRSPEVVGARAVGFFFLPGKDDEAAAELIVHLLETKPLGPAWFFGLPGETRVFAGPGELAPAMRAVAATTGITGAARKETPEHSLDAFTRRMRQRGAGIVVVVTGMQPAQPYDNYLGKPEDPGRHTLVAVRSAIDSANVARTNSRQFVTISSKPKEAR